MKMVTAYIERESFEPIREELLGLGFLSLSAWEASGSVPEALVTASYRGTAIETHLRPKTRLECVVGSDQVSTVVDTGEGGVPCGRSVSKEACPPARSLAQSFGGREKKTSFTSRKA